jgi:hypothetical protein
MGRVNAGYARVTTSSQSRLVSMATTLSGPLSDTGGCLISQRFVLAAVSGRPLQKPRMKSSGVCVLNCSAFRDSDPSTSLIRTAHTSWIIFEWEGRARSEHETEEKKSGCDQIGYQLKLPDPIVSLAPYQFARDRLLSFAILLAAEER